MAEPGRHEMHIQTLRRVYQQVAELSSLKNWHRGVAGDHGLRELLRAGARHSFRKPRSRQ